MKRAHQLLTRAGIVGFLCLFTVASTAVYSQETTGDSTSSGQVDLETIKENVKKRIEEVVKTDPETMAAQPVAYMGPVESVANQTLSITTMDGLKLAATNDQTAVIQLPGGKTVKLDDVAIDDYVTAIGYVNQEEVLDTRRLLVQDLAPQSSPYSTSVGHITAVDSKARTITLANSQTGDTQTFLDTNSSDLLSQTVSGASQAEYRSVGALPLNQPALVTYVPAEEPGDDLIIKTLLVKLVTSPSPAAAEASPAARVKGTTTPPELDR